MKRIWGLAMRRDVLVRALLVALVIGTILNLINQGDALVSGAPIDGLKLVLTYLVPYFVSTHGAVMAQWRDSRG